MREKWKKKRSRRLRRKRRKMRARSSTHSHLPVTYFSTILISTCVFQSKTSPRVRSRNTSFELLVFTTKKKKRKDNDRPMTEGSRFVFAISSLASFLKALSCRVCTHTMCTFYPFLPQGCIILQPRLFGSSLGWICPGDAFIVF